MEHKEKTIVITKEDSRPERLGFWALLFFLIIFNYQTALAQTPISVSAVVEEFGGGGSGGGGGGSGSSSTEIPEIALPLPSSVTISGFAYRNGPVSILQGGQEVETLSASLDASFSTTLENIIPGVHNFSIHGEDSSARRSPLLNFTVSVPAGAQIELANVFLPPTLSIPRRQISPLGAIELLGESVPGSTIFFESSQIDILSKGTDILGKYFSTTNLLAQTPNGPHTIRVKSVLPDGTESTYSALATFFVGDTATELVESECGVGDSNCDGGINILDFSILAYWFRLGNPPAGIDLTDDGEITIEDFSILAYYWSR